MLQDWIPPGIIVLLIPYVWRDLRTDLGGRIERINDRLDRHLEGHP